VHGYYMQHGRNLYTLTDPAGRRAPRAARGSRGAAVCTSPLC